MGHEFLPLKKAAAHVHMAERELLHCAQRGEVPAEKRGEEWYFDHRLLDEWSQRHLLELDRRKLGDAHQKSTLEQRECGGDDLMVTPLLAAGAAETISAKTRAGVIRDMAELADRTGYIYDPEEYHRELVAREDAASTAIGGGAAFMHARFHDPYHASDSFIALGRAVAPVHFGSQDGEPTDLFFLICCTDHSHHLRVLARLAMMAYATDMLERLRAAASEEEVLEIVRSCELEILAGAGSAGR